MYAGRWACLFWMTGCSGPAITPDAFDRCAGVPAAELLASEPLQTPSDIAHDDQFVYWANFHGDAIRRVPKLGGAAETIAVDVSPEYVAVDATHVYWLDGSGDLMRVPTSGGTVELLAEGMGCVDSYPCGVAIMIDDQAIYWAEKGAPQQIMRLAKSGGIAALDAEGLMTETLAADAEHIYFGALIYDGLMHHALRRIPKVGGAFETLFVLDQAFFAGIALSTTHAYVAGEDAIWQVAKDRSESIRFVELTMPRRIAVDGTAVYATNGDTVQRITLDGSTVDTIACDQQSARSLALDDTRIYWNDSTAGTINTTLK